jgi:hypothetical protein
MKSIHSILLFLIALVTISNAAGWEGTAAIAVVTSAAMLGLIYMIGFGFGINELVLTSKEEAYQLVVVMVLIGGFVLLQTGGDAILSAIGENEGIQQTSVTMTSSMITELSSMFMSLANLETQIAVEGSRSLTCSILSVGYTISGCGGYTMVAPALSGVETTVGLAIAELSSIAKLMEIGINNSFAILLPIGIIFRTFKLTRGAGGLIIAVAISLYFILPLSMITMWKVADQFKNAPEGASYTGTAPSISVSSCVPADSGEGNSEKSTGILHQLVAAMPFYLFPTFIYGIITPAIALLITVTGIRVISSMAGADVDVSALSRVI